MSLRFVACATGICFGLLGCSAQSSQYQLRSTTLTRATAIPDSSTQQPQLLKADSQCGFGKQAFVRWINNPTDLRDWLNKMQRLKFAATPDKTPELDFQTDIGLLLYMGQKNSGGYAMLLAKQALMIKDNTARLAIEWKTPQPGMMQTQALQSPCMIIKLPTGNYRKLEVIDQHGIMRFALPRH